MRPFFTSTYGTMWLPHFVGYFDCLGAVMLGEQFRELPQLEPPENALIMQML